MSKFALVNLMQKGKNLYVPSMDDGPQREELEAQAPGNMIFTGYLKGEELAEVYSNSDVFVFPSPTETFGNVVLEALASGTPVLYANSAGVKHLIKDE